MGLGMDFLKALANEATKKTERMQHDFETKKRVYDRLDDETLKERYNNATGVERTAMREVLKERDYDN